MLSEWIKVLQCVHHKACKFCLPRAPAVATAIGARVILGAKQRATPSGARVPPSRPIGSMQVARSGAQPKARCSRGPVQSVHVQGVLRLRRNCRR